MPIKRRDADGFFNRKVPGSVRSEQARHLGFRIVSREGVVLLPNLTLSRGPSGEDLDHKNVKGLADDVGLSLDGFLEACKCRIRKEYVVYCIVNRVVVHACRLHAMDRIAFGRDMADAFSSAVTAWLVEEGPKVKLKPSKLERREVERAIKRRAEEREVAAMFAPLCTLLTEIESMICA